MNTADVAPAATLVTLALDPRRRPATDEDYAEQLARYRTDPTFAATVGQVASGMGLDVLADDTVLGLVVAARPSSPLAIDVPWLRARLPMPSADDRLLFGVIIAGIAAWCYPTRQSLVEPATDRFHIRDVDAAVCRPVAALADDVDGDPDSLDAAWQAWDDRPQAELTASGTNYKAGTRLRMIQQACSLLSGLGLLLAADEADTWRPTDRFRRHLAHHGGPLAYRTLLDAGADVEPLEPLEPAPTSEGA